MTAKRFEDPRWIEAQTLALDCRGAMAQAVGDQGLRDEELAELAPRLAAAQAEVAAARREGRLAFLELPYQVQGLPEIRGLTKPLLEWCWELVVLARGAAALGVKALHQALCHPQHNYLPMGRRHYRPSLWLLEDPDPDQLYGLLDSLQLRRTVVNVISKSGDEPQTVAGLLFIYHLFRGRVADRARESLIVTTDPEAGLLRRLADLEGFPSLSLPGAVPGHFALLSPAGLLPAAMLGIDLEELLAGARFMDQRLTAQAPGEHLAWRLAALVRLLARRRGCSRVVLLAGAGALEGVAAWFPRLWAENLGEASPASLEAVPPASWQPYLEGPRDQLFAFLTVDKFQHHLEVPRLFGDRADLAHLEGRSLNGLVQEGWRDAAGFLGQTGRPSLTLSLPEVNAFTIGQLLYLLQFTAAAAASLAAVDSE